MTDENKNWLDNQKEIKTRKGPGFEADFSNFEIVFLIFFFLLLMVGCAVV